VPTAPPASSPRSFANGRYQVRELLGEGSKKRVYRAHDTLLDREVAFALIKIDGLDDAGRERVRREARAMGRLGSHPNIVSVLDLGEEHGQPYLVTELMPGGDLGTLLHGAPDHRLPLEQVLEIGQQLCRALEHAHTRQVIHRDLKPGNIWLSDSGIVKLGDFGLAVALDQTRHTQPGMMIGTVSYMAPEQAIGGNVDARSDLYALGCVLYELVCGRPPFVGDESVAIITQHLNTPPVAASWHRAECPPGLDSLLTRLLEKDPERRLADARQVSAALSAVDLGSPVSAGQSVLVETAPASAGALYHQAFVGREAELQQLKDLFDAACSGNGGLAMIVGEPGIGKTSLSEQLATYVAVRGGATLVGHSYEEGSLSLPYLPFVEALRSLVLASEPEVLRSALGSAGGDVARIVSEIRERVAVEPRPPSGDPEEDRWRLMEAVTGFLRNASSLKPTVLILEDLHWADRGTLDLLTYLARQLGGSRLLIVGTYRDVEVDRTHPLSSALAELRRGSPFSRIALRGLSVDEVHRMMQQIRGQTIPWSRAEAIHRQTEGNPLFVQEVLRYLVEEGLVVREGDQWVRTDGTDPEAGIPEGLRDVIGKRLSRLSPDANHVLTMAAVIGREFRLDVLQLLARNNDDGVVAALEEAQARAIIEERRSGTAGSPVFRFTHAFFRQTLYEEIFAARRIQWHQQVGRALEQVYGRRVDDHAAELAEHFANSSDADDLAKAVHYGELAAQRAMGIYAYGEAARHLGRALQAQEVLGPDDAARRCDLLLALGQAMLPTESIEAIPESIAEEAFQLGLALNDRTRAGDAAVLALEALAHRSPRPSTYQSEPFQQWSLRADEFTTEGTAARVYAHVHGGMARLFVDGPAPAHIRLREALREAELLGHNRELYLAAGWAFRHLIALMDFPTLDRLAIALNGRSRDGAKAVDVGICLRYLGSNRLGFGDRDMAEQVWDELGQLSNMTHDIALHLLSMETQAILHYFDGDLTASLQACRDREAGSTGPGYLRDVYVRIYLYLGMNTEEIEYVVNANQTRPFRAARASHLAHHGRFDESARLVADFHGFESVDDESAAMVLLHLLEATTLLGDVARAGTLYSRLLPFANRVLASESHLACISRILAGCDRLLKRPDMAREHLVRAIEQCTAVGFRPELALARLELAELLFDSYPGEETQAFAHLDTAIGELRAMGMQPLLERALRRRMRAQGVESISSSTSIDAVSRAVIEERPGLERHAAPDGTVTLLFTDIEGSTDLTLKLGDQRWLDVLRAHHALVREHVQAHGGFEVKCQGDGFMLAFQSARRALECAIVIQRAVAAVHTDPPIRVRMGLHTGEALKDADDFHGRDVVLAARIADQAVGGEILVSALLKELLAGRGDVQFGDERDSELKGLVGMHRMYAVEWA
jgi:class 3 adenylate cyclase